MALSQVNISFYPPPGANRDPGAYASGPCEPPVKRFICFLLRSDRANMYSHMFCRWKNQDHLVSFNIIRPRTRISAYFATCMPPSPQTHLFPRQRITIRSQVIPRVPQRTPDMRTPVCTHRRPPKTFFTRSQVESRQNITSSSLVTFTHVYFKKDICTTFYPARHVSTYLLYHVQASFMGLIQFYPEKYHGNMQNFDPSC